MLLLTSSLKRLCQVQRWLRWRMIVFINSSYTHPFWRFSCRASLMFTRWRHSIIEYFLLNNSLLHLQRFFCMYSSTLYLCLCVGKWMQHHLDSRIGQSSLVCRNYRYAYYLIHLAQAPPWTWDIRFSFSICWFPLKCHMVHHKIIIIKKKIQLIIKYCVWVI